MAFVKVTIAIRGQWIALKSSNVFRHRVVPEGYRTRGV